MPLTDEAGSQLKQQSEDVEFEREETKEGEVASRNKGSENLEEDEGPKEESKLKQTPNEKSVKGVKISSLH